MREKICGIYAIKNISNKKIYIGQSIDIYSRWEMHKYKLRKNVHINKHLQSSWNKYKESNFEFFIIYKFKKWDILLANKKEKFYIKKFNSGNNNYGYNKTLGGDGVVPTEETKNKKSESIIKYWSDIKNREIHSGKNNPLYGIPLGEDRKRKMSENHSDVKGSKNPMFGRKHLQETLDKIIKNMPNMEGENNPFYNKKHDDETRKKMSESHSGQNSFNFGKKAKNSSSIFFGVSYYTERSNWQVSIKVNSKKVGLGRFKNEIDGARAYDKYVVENNLPNPLNFPEDYPERGENK